jgi:AcrR family transcriptional regulator
MRTGAASFQRARSPEHKQQRRDAILDAARQLAVRDGVRNVSLGDIAAEIGIHKSALLRYFETREQIFLELTAQSWQEWADALQAELEASPSATATVVADLLARSFAERPLLCDLIPHTALTHERNVSVEAVRRYKLTSLGAIAQTTNAIHRALPELTVDECREVVSAIASLAGALWQIANPPPALAELYSTDPELGHACVELTPRLRRTAALLIAGLIPSRGRDVDRLDD